MRYVLQENNDPSLKALLRWMPLNASLTENDSDDDWNGDEVFHNSTMNLNNDFPVTTAICGEIYRNYHEVCIILAVFILDVKLKTKIKTFIPPILLLY